MSRWFLPLFLAATLAGCGALTPYPTAPLGAQPKAPPDAGPRVAICYNPLHSNKDDARAQAQHECAAGTTATRVDTDWYLQNCPLLLPERATFVCAPHK